MFIQAYETRGFNEPAEAYGAFAFAATDLIIDVIEKVGPDRKLIRDELNVTQEHESIVGPVTFDSYGQNTIALITKYVIQDGSWVLWEDSEYALGNRSLK
jgi:branched-chain amino acid transport system substrate-binding protein